LLINVSTSSSLPSKVLISAVTVEPPTLLLYTLEPSFPVKPILSAISPSAACALVTSAVKSDAEAISDSEIT